MKRRLLIRVETIDGDVDYYEPSEKFCYFLEMEGLKVDRFVFANEFYPEYRPSDLFIRLGFFDAPEVI